MMEKTSENEGLYNEQINAILNGGTEKNSRKTLRPMTDVF